MEGEKEERLSNRSGREGGRGRESIRDSQDERGNLYDREEVTRGECRCAWCENQTTREDEERVLIY